MHIVLTNDDGIGSPGIRALACSLSKIARITVLAPDHNCSSNSHCLTVDKAVPVQQVSFPHAEKAYAIGGTPTDCIHLGLKKLVDEPVDLVVSGINLGANLTTDTLYSGTLGAAMDAVLMGVPAMAVSLDSFVPDADFDPAAQAALAAVKWYLPRSAGLSSALNVNVPALPTGQIKGFRYAELDRIKYYTGPLYLRQEQDGKECYILHEEGYDLASVSEDLRLVSEGYITLTPISCFWADHARLQSWQATETLPVF